MNTLAHSTRVLIADDHGVVRHGLNAIIGLQPGLEVVGMAADGEEALRLYFELAPDVLVLDLRMPRLDGVEVVRRITARQPDARILIVTTYDTDENISQALRAGAKGYLLKDSSNEQIADAIRAVGAGEVFLPPAVAAKFVASSLRPELSRRELQILGLMARGLSNKLIARELSIEETTVKTHATSLFVKLGVRSRTEALAEAARRGLTAPA